jgi:outer membrane protein OmpA-like peptidoglycan-associated protein
MKKVLTSLICLLLLSFSPLVAQDFLGYSMSNYSGITGAYINPASIADSRFKFDMELVGLDLGFSNNYIGLSKDPINHRNLFSDPQFQKKYLVERMNGDNKALFFNESLHLPAFMIRINPKNSVGFVARQRMYITLDGLEANLAHQVYKGLTDTAQYFQTLTNKQLSVQFNAWAEYGLTFAHVFRNKDQHFLKAGITLKVLQGLGAAYMYVNDLNYRVSNKDTLSFFNTKAGYGHSTNFTNDPKQGYKIGSTLGFGGDIGVEYEYRPDYDKYKYDMDGETNMDMRWKNKYKFKFGLSLLDVGGIRYSKGDGKDFTGNVNLWNIAKSNIKTLPQLDSTLKSKFTMNPSDNSFYMHLPTTINFQADYCIYKTFYAGLMGVYAFQFSNAESKVHELSKIAFVPRWDHKWFGVYIPVSYDAFKNFNYGLNLRLGPVILGSNAINSYFGSSNVYGAEFHVLLKIPIPYSRVKDRDKDKVSDKKDKCPDTPGTWEFMGCPDRDGDHIPDSEDQCPDQPGTKEMHGCPDRDGDKIIDRLDSCPDNPGPPELNGCPDRDGDKVIDKEDECPDTPGLPQFKGCPDTDGDGVPDKIDKCPDKKGTIENEGCPEVFLLLLDKNFNVLKKVKQSKDGSFNFETLEDEKNAIFSIEGDDTGELKELNLVVNGVPKKIARSPDRYFRLEELKADENKIKEMEEKDVAIKLTVEEAKVLKKAFNNLEFETGKEIIKPESLPALDELAVLMKKKPEWKLKLTGYTDNQGKLEDNMKLSEKRAKAVSHYLIMRGVDDKRFKILFFGPDKPIAPNTTPQGRQKNRRVEMLIID